MNIARAKDECDPFYKKLLDQRETAAFVENDKCTDSLYCCIDQMLLHKNRDDFFHDEKLFS